MEIDGYFYIEFEKLLNVIKKKETLSIILCKEILQNILDTAYRSSK
jgi:hypothetical protein